MEQIKAKLEKCIYKDNNGTVKVALFRFPDKSEIVVGDVLPDDDRNTYLLEGEYVVHPKYKKQFRCVKFSIVLPDKIVGIKRFLTSGIIKGIGKISAEKIVEVFKEDSLKIIEKEPEKLLTIKGFSKKKVEKIATSYKENVVNCNAMMALMQSGLSDTKASKIIHRFGTRTAEIFESTPYRFSIITGITFPEADNLKAERTKEYLTSFDRFYYASRYVLLQNEYGACRAAQGSLYMEYADYAAELEKLLGRDYPEATLQENLKKSIDDKKLKCFYNGTKAYITTFELFTIERELAENIAELANDTGSKKSVDIKILKDKEEAKGITLNIFQEEAVMSSLKEKIMLLIGAPGTGKTTTIQFIAEMCREQDKTIKDIVLLAPTGRAAKRITESSGLAASTIHSFLRIGGDNEEQEWEPEPITNSLIIVDEVSMLDARVAHKLFNSIGSGSRIVLCGDDAQLQSVGAGAVLRDIQNSEKIKTVRLETVYRQQKGGDIFYNVDNIRHGKTELATGGDFMFCEVSDMETTEDIMTKAYEAKVKEFGIENVMMLAPFKKHAAGVDALNKKAQDMINPHIEGAEEYVLENRTFRKGDYVLNLTNTDELVNGDIGFIVDISLDEDGKKTVTASFNGVERTYDSKDINELTLAYAMTVHKSQGSEAKCVITCINRNHSVMLKRNIVYTALSRAKEQVYLIGERNAFNKAVRTESTDERITFLRQMLRGLIKE